MAMTASLRGLPACNTEACGLSRTAYRHLWNTTGMGNITPPFNGSMRWNRKFGCCGWLELSQQLFGGWFRRPDCEGPHPVPALGYFFMLS